MFSEVPFTADFYSTLLVTSRQYVWIFSAQSTVVTQLFIIVPWLFFILPPLFVPNTALVERLYSAFIDLLEECDTLLSQTLFAESLDARMPVGDVVLVVVAVAMLLPVCLGLYVCTYVVCRLGTVRARRQV
jgi:hypothetical protein